MPFQIHSPSRVGNRRPPMLCCPSLDRAVIGNAVRIVSLPPTTTSPKTSPRYQPTLQRLPAPFPSSNSPPSDDTRTHSTIINAPSSTFNNVGGHQINLNIT